MSPVRRLYAAIVLALATLAGIPSLAHAAGEDERILTFGIRRVSRPGTWQPSMTGPACSKRRMC